MPDWISRTLGRVRRSREWTNSSSDKAIVRSWVVYRSDSYKNLWLLDVSCLQLLSLLIIPPSGRQKVEVEPNQGGQPRWSGTCPKWLFFTISAWSREEVTLKPSPGGTTRAGGDRE